jgi:hypothetical protein
VRHPPVAPARPVVLAALAAWSALAAFPPAARAAGCEDVAKALFGFGLGPAAGYLEALKPALRREGTARLVPDVGFESLAGAVDGVDWERVMAFVDHGRFYSVVAVGTIASAPDRGFEAITQRVAQASGLQPAVADARARFACAAPYELVVESRPAPDGARIAVSLADTERRAAAQRYVQAWCADPANKDQPSACKK